MGILAGVADILCELSVKRRFHGSLAMLRKQNVIVTPE